MENKSEEHLTFESYKEQINIWYKVHNIVREKAELYYDFLFSLLTLIDETYLGPDVLNTEEDISNHFKWCYNKTILNFEQEKIYFTGKNGQYEYLFVFFYKAYYTNYHEGEDQAVNLGVYFKLLFTYNKIKTPVELESFVDMYKIFEQNLKKIN